MNQPENTSARSGVAAEKPELERRSPEALSKPRKRHYEDGRDIRRDPTYKSWCCMKSRCYNQNSYQYKWYGMRGLTVCERWKNSFQNFLSDMGERPIGTTLERKDRNGIYEPSNCKWATQKEQMRNTSRNRLLTFDGESKPLTEWAEMFDIPAARVAARIKLGWKDADALTAKKWGRSIEFKGETRTIREWSEITGIKTKTIWYRVSSGWTASDALTIPTQRKINP